MKNTFVKAFITILIISCASAVFAAPLTDTIPKNILLASAGTNNTIVLKKANLVCPSIFCGSENEFMGYVEKFSAGRRDYILRTYKMSRRFFPKAIAILQKHNIPAEFAVLLALESGFNANAISSAGAVGYWQMMDEVAKEYGLRIAQKEKPAATKNKKSVLVKLPTVKAKAKPQPDDRTNFIKSTYAAAKYLRDRHRNLNGNWLLITASYNCGIGNVWDAMARSGKTNPTFWDIKKYLPAETQAYVMNFITLNVLFKNYEKFAGNDLCFKDIVVVKPEPIIE